MSDCVNKGCAAYKGHCLNDMQGVVCYGFIPPITNYDLLIRKTPEELAKFLGSIIHDYGQGTAEIEGAEYVIDDWLDWLKQEVSDGRDD